MLLFNSKSPYFKAVNVCILLAFTGQIFSPAIYAAEMESIKKTLLENHRLELESGTVRRAPAEMILSKNGTSIVQSVKRSDSGKLTENVNLGQAATTLSGPGQSESSGFSLNSTDGMVDKFSGDFNYSIPLMDVEGFPIVMSYNSNVTMNSEASWVGLGWDLNLGSVSRQMRGIPDEFEATDKISRTSSVLEDDSWGRKMGGYLALSYSFEPGGVGGPLFTPGIQITSLVGKYRTDYLGLGRTHDFGLQVTFNYSSSSTNDGNQNPTGFLAGLNLGIGYSSDSKRGITTNKNLGFEMGHGEDKGAFNISAQIGNSKSTRGGLLDKEVGWFAGYQQYLEKEGNQHTSGFSVSHSAILPYGTVTAIPRVAMNTDQTNFTFGLTGFGSTKVPSGFQIQVGGQVNFSTGKTKTKYNGDTYQQSTLGYYHSGKRDYITAWPLIMDFHRNYESEYSEEMPDIPGSYQTYDIFYYNSPAGTGSFRGYRTDFGTYKDPTMKIQTNHFSQSSGSGFLASLPPIILGMLNSVFSPNIFQVKIGVSSPNNLHIGLGMGQQKSVLTTNDFGDHGTNPGKLKFEYNDVNSDFDETVYFRNIGEETPSNLDGWGYMGGNSPVNFPVSVNNKEIEISASINSSPVSSVALNATAPKPIMSELINPIIAQSVSQPILSYQSGGMSYLTFPRTDAIKKSNHISQLEIINSSGQRVVYGIPAYDNYHGDVSFSVSGSSANGLLTGYSAAESSTANTSGRSHYYDKTTMPGYAHSFLLTELYSNDYVDRQNDGPTLDDVGNYYKVNYNRKASSFKWRAPVNPGTDPVAYYNKGVLGSDLDDMASYSFGDKELWYAHSVESKNFIAIFILDDRMDGYQVDESGYLITSGVQSQYLKEIRLYNREEYYQNPTTAKPLQSVLFYYDYSQCKNYPGNYNTHHSNYAESGKLTLREVRVISGTSKSNGLSSYQFDYSGGGNNPDFDYNNTDAWDCYQVNNTTRPNVDFSYTRNTHSDVNNTVDSDLRAYAWKLATIELPTGGSYQIDYENDTYGYVQDKRAMRFFVQKGMMSPTELFSLLSAGSWNGTTNLSNNFIQSVGSSSNPENHNVLVFELDSPLAVSDQTSAHNAVKEMYFTDDYNGALMTDLVVRNHVFIKNDVEELIPSYSTIDPGWDNAVGAMPPVGGVYQYGYVILKTLDLDAMYTEDKKTKLFNNKHYHRELHPLQRDAIDYARANLPDKIYGACVSCDGDLSVDKDILWGKEVYEAFIDDAGYAASIVPEKSLIRLYEPDRNKRGGNARVKLITYNDNWDAISGEYASSYQWKYTYETNNGRTDGSNGVSSFEPKTILEENPLYKWITYRDIKKKFPDERKMQVYPSFVDLYPNPGVGYEQVKVNFVQSGAIEKGYSITSYHTYKNHDFAVKETSTGLLNSGKATFSNLGSFTTFLGAKGLDFYGFSEGYLIETNDFHGKINRVETFDGFGAPQASTVYNYYDLTEELPMLDRTGALATYNTGVEYDIHGDERSVQTSSRFSLGGVSFKIALSFGPISFMPYYTWNNMDQAFYSYCLVKHINRSARVKSIQTSYLGSVNTAENMIYDKFSGNVIVSSLTDEFNDKLYSMSYPGHWYYTGLRELVQGTQPVINGTMGIGAVNEFACGSSSIDLRDYFTAGDYVSLTDLANPSNVYNVRILSVMPNSFPSSVQIIEENGSAANYSGSFSIKLLKSYRSNRLNETVQQVVTKKAISTVPTSSFVFPESEIISSGAITYHDKQNLKCLGIKTAGDPAATEVREGTVINPFNWGIMGKPVMDKSFSWQSDRINNSHQLGIRYDGTYSEYIPFYKLKPGDKQWYMISESGHPNHTSDTYQKWRPMGEVRVYNSDGTPLEAVDQLNVPSTVIYGYNSQLELVPVAQAVNAHKQEIGFDGFEDYDYLSTLSGTLVSPSNYHFTFKNTLSGTVVVDNTIRHSGLKSLKVTSGSATLVSDMATVCATQGDGVSAGEFVASTCVCIPPFRPDAGKDYVVGGWIYKGSSSGKMHVTVTGGSGTTNIDVDILPTGKEIDGWVRMEGVVSIPNTGTYYTMSISLVNTGASAVYFDDVRVHPFLAGMTTVVYDPVTLLPLATHDGYNFTTFYNYDENLQLVRVRVETEEGIKTVTETNFGGKINYTE